MPGNPLTDPNFAADTADRIDRIVGTVRRKAVQPIVTAARAAVFGLLAAFLGVFALVLLLVGLTRGLQAFLALWIAEPRTVYLSYLIIGALLCAVGMVLMSKRSPGTPT